MESGGAIPRDKFVQDVDSADKLNFDMGAMGIRVGLPVLDRYCLLSLTPAQYVYRDLTSLYYELGECQTEYSIIKRFWQNRQ